MALSLASPAIAAPEGSARLVSCAEADCLLVSGSRAHAGAAVRINGHPVQPQGGRTWKVLLPVDTVRAWSLPGARNIAVTTLDPETKGAVTTQVRLPIGMLGSITELASLVILQR
ncbi:hypothetical protein [Novosphingobium soli]|uniref:Uncharacterized protein n=1 Tax=Novosphingobium soli TaxID=574956 RepID=A0ABV6CU29_9SPHN